MHGAAALLADAYPGRLVLGLGVGYPFQAAQVGRDYGRPLATIRDYLEQMTAGPPLAQVPELSYPRILAANGPKMLALAGEIADGAIPTLVPPQYTAGARQILGPDKILVIGLTVAVDDDPARAQAAARQFVSQIVGRPGSPYAANLTAWAMPRRTSAPPPTRWSTRSSPGATRNGSRPGSAGIWTRAPIMCGWARSRRTSRPASKPWNGSPRC